MGFFAKATKFFAMRFVELTFVLALVLLMPSVPPYGQYTEYKITPPLPLEGPLAENHLLENAEKLFVDEIVGPESFADYNGELYFSVLTGQILKMTGDKLVQVVSFANEKCKGFHTEPDCGRPLGLKFDNNGNLIVMESYSGIWEVDIKTGRKKLLISAKQEIDGRPLGIPNSLAIAKNGDIYWTDSSSEYQLRDIIYTFFADGTGRLFKYTAATKTNEVLIDKLYFANGVHLSENEDFVIVNDLLKSRVLRYYLKGPKKGTHDVFLDGLPGLPDNIASNKRGGFLIGLVVAVDDQHPNFAQIFSPFPLIRKFMARIIGLLDFGLQTLNNMFPNYFLEVAIHYVGNYKPLPLLTPKRTTIIEVDNDGNIIRSFHALNGSITGICEGYIFDKYMYLGSPYNKYLARVKLSDLGIDSSEFKTKSIPQKQQSKTTTTPSTTSVPKATTPTPTPKPTAVPRATTTTTPRPTTRENTATKPRETTTTTSRPPTQQPTKKPVEQKPNQKTNEKAVPTERAVPVQTPGKEQKPIVASTTEKPPTTTPTPTTQATKPKTKVTEQPEVKQNDKKIKVEATTSSPNKQDAKVKNEL